MNPGIRYETIVFTIGCIFLIRQCFEPFFLGKTRVPYQKCYTPREVKFINRGGKIFTAVFFLWTVFMWIVPDIRQIIFN